jgi:putative transcriptional regulator
MPAAAAVAAAVSLAAMAPGDASSAVMVAAALLVPVDTLAGYVAPGGTAATTAGIRAGQSGTTVLTFRILAHDWPMEESLSGRLLAATPQLGDPNFRRTVVLIVEDDTDEGTLGVVLNRPTEVPLDQVLEPWTGLATGPQVVFRGGPISPNSALALAIANGGAEPVGWRSLDGSPLMSRIGLVDLGAPPELLAGGISSMRVFAGYAGWGAGQLRDEIEDGAWFVLPGDPAAAFAAEPERLWREVLRNQGGDLALVASFPDDPVWN